MAGLQCQYAYLLARLDLLTPPAFPIGVTPKVFLNNVTNTGFDIKSV